MEECFLARNVKSFKNTSMKSDSHTIKSSKNVHIGHKEETKIIVISVLEGKKKGGRE